jgi:two-component system, chemotaxis family, CheB/CheR fusion protein
MSMLAMGAEAADGDTVTPDHVYVCPPDHTLTIHNGRLRLKARAPTGLHMPIDIFLSSLAEDHRENTIGMLLSGGGSDGTLGLKTIKEQGGLTLAQVADGGISPKQTGMPDTAIAAGVVDLMVPIEEMPRRLVDHVRRYWPLIGTADFRAKNPTSASNIRRSIKRCCNTPVTTSAVTSKRLSGVGCSGACRCWN